MRSAFVIYFLLIVFGLNATVYETVADGPWNSNSIWTPSKPNPTWSNTNDTIIIKHNVNLTNNINLYGQTLIVESAASLTQSGNKNVTITNGSKVIIDGSMDVNNFTLNWNNPSVDVNGDLSVNNLLINSGDFDNSGDLEVDGSLTNKSDFVNSGSATIDSYVDNISSSSYLNNSGSMEVGSYFDNKGEFVNTGSLTIDSYFFNKYSASSLDNSGDIDVGGDFTNDGDFDNSGDLSVGGDYENRYSNSDLSNTGDIEVIGDFANDGNIDNDGPVDVGGDFTNTGDVDNGNNIVVDGAFENDWGSDLTNTGVVSVSDDFTNKGDVTNTNYFNVDGDFTSDYSTSVTNTGILEIEEDLSNNGSFVNDGDLTVDGTADSPGGAITGDGNLCSSAGTDPSGSGTIDNNICGGDDVGLPVELIEFEAELINDFVVISWITASEQNNSYFEIQLSENAIDFYTIEKVQGAGNSNTTIEYKSEISDKLEDGIYYFRLKQVDFDGSASFSEAKSIEIYDNQLNLKIYPIPANSLQDIRIEFDEIMEIHIELYSLNGKLLYQDIKITNNYSFNSLNLDNSNYIIRIRSGQKTYVGKMHIIP